MCSGLRGDHPRSNALTSPLWCAHQAALLDPVGKPILEFLVGQVIHLPRMAAFHDLERAAHTGSYSS